MSSAVSDSIIGTTPATASAYAKINLTLDVLSRRDDGFHEIRSLVIGVDLGDEIRVSSRPEAGLVFTCADPRMAGSDNLVGRAARELASHCGREPSLCIELDKRIPISAGLGGGSSDAATTLRLCNRLWELGLDDVELAQIGARLGSDVPLFFSLPAAMISGRGERVEPVTLRWSGWVLLVSVGADVSTPDVYAHWHGGDSTGDLRGVEQAVMNATSAGELSALVTNRLQPAVFRTNPEVARVHDRLNRAGYGPMTVSGAGSTMYRFFDDRDEACHLAIDIEAQGLDVMTAVVAAPVGPGAINMNWED